MTETYNEIEYAFVNLFKSDPVFTLRTELLFISDEQKIKNHPYLVGRIVDFVRKNRYYKKKYQCNK